MSKDKGRLIQILSIVIGAVGAIACAVMTIVSMKGTDILVTFAWLFLAIIFVVLIVPIWAIGNLVAELVEMREQLQKTNDKLNRFSRQAETGNPADRFSPSGSIKISKLPQTQMRTVAPTRQTGSGAVVGEQPAGRRPDAERPITPPAQTTSSVSEDFTRSLDPKTIEDAVKDESTLTRSRDSISIEPSPTLQDAFRQSGSVYPSPAPFTTTGYDMFRVNRKNGQVTRILRNMATTISAGGLHSAFVFSSGRVYAVGSGTYGQCNVTDWRNVIAVSCGNHHTVGLRSDGRCLATGYNGYGQCEVGEWRNVCQISAGFGHTVGLLENGTCVAVGDNAYGQCNVFDWSDIVSIVAGYNYTVGLKVDGTIVAVGANTDGQWGAIKWGSIADVAAGDFHTVGLKNDGTCVAVGNNANDQCNVSDWKGIISVAAGNYHTIGLRADGTCIATGYNGYGQCDVGGWSNIVAVSAGRNFTIGITANGRAVAVGDNPNGQCNVGALTSVMIPRVRE